MPGYHETTPLPAFGRRWGLTRVRKSALGRLAATWTVYASIAKSVAILMRIKDLTWHHHRVVAPLGPGKQG